MFLVTGCLAAALVCATAVSTPASSAEVLPTDPPKVGDPFPLLAFPSLEDGTLQTMADFRGTKVLLIQFASW